MKEEKMKEETVIVSRHTATIEWLKEKHPDAMVKNSFHPGDIEKMSPGDLVVGNLPLLLIHALNKAGVDYYAVEFDRFPPRGVELSQSELNKYGVRETPYLVMRSDLAGFYATARSLMDQVFYTTDPEEIRKLL